MPPFSGRQHPFPPYRCNTLFCPFLLGFSRFYGQSYEKSVKLASTGKRNPFFTIILHGFQHASPPERIPAQWFGNPIHIPDKSSCQAFYHRTHPALPGRCHPVRQHRRGSCRSEPLRHLFRQVYLPSAVIFLIIGGFYNNGSNSGNMTSSFTSSGCRRNMQ